MHNYNCITFQQSDARGKGHHGFKGFNIYISEETVTAAMWRRLLVRQEIREEKQHFPSIWKVAEHETRLESLNAIETGSEA